ncbi:hypothetical protein LTR36_002963 [Oleoguttula mirabilis]|uniref:Uncharacterized protein n=1 Tax=Oleoguttula mirabilis TaxID=1507867 RepID=A0AAV9JXV6_9PEZI|nr:hypothetical protein LTR36_002963 [Oleoguttula mirabilis]
MRSTTAAALALLASSALALPTTTSNQPVTKRQSSNAAAVSSNIAAWQVDIENVNGFLDNAQNAINTNTGYNYPQEASFSLGTVGKSCPGPNGCASDGETRFANLKALLPSNDTHGQAAAAQLDISIPGVIGNLTAITQASPTDIPSIQAAINSLNDLRCNVVLPAIAQLWYQATIDTEDTAGTPSSIPAVSGPSACAAVGTATL